MKIRRIQDILRTGVAIAGGDAVRHARAAAAPVKILALGTSLTQGYGLPPGTEFTAVLAGAAEGRRASTRRSINAGVSGDTSAGGLARLDWSLADHPDAAIVELGSNDALRGLAARRDRKELAAILAQAEGGAYARAAVRHEGAAQFRARNMPRNSIAIYPRLAKQYGALLYPFILDGVALNPKLNQADGMHPNPAGVKIIVERMLPYVKKLVAGET